LRLLRGDQSEVPAGGGELGLLVTVAEQPVVTNPMKALGKDVQDKPAEEVGGLEMEDLLLAAVCVVSPAKPYDSVGVVE